MKAPPFSSVVIPALTDKSQALDCATSLCSHTLPALLLAALGGLARAEEPDLYELSLAQLLSIKISGSTMSDAAPNRVPSAVTVFTREQIRLLNVATVEELLNLVPGFQRFRQGGDGLLYTYSARGRRINSGVGEILTLVDGVQQASPRLGNSAAAVAGIAIGTVERVEFIRGPGSALYGSNAMMGVINIITTRFHNDVKITGGSFERQAAELSLASAWGEVALDAHARFDTDNGDTYVVPASFTRVPTTTTDAHDIADLYVKAHWRDSALLLRRGTRETRDFYVLDLLKNDVNRLASWRNQYALTQELDFAAGHGKWLLSYTNDYLSLRSEFLPAGALLALSAPASADALRARAVFESNKWQLTWHQDWPLSVGSVQAGLDLRRIQTTKAIAYNNFDFGDLANRHFPIRYYGEMLPTTPLENHVTRDNYGLYLQYLRPLATTTDLTLGLRYDDYLDIGQQLSPRLGLVQQLKAGHTLKLLYGEAFRAPSNGETELINNPVLVGNPELQPESVVSWDLIWMMNWQDLALTLGYFENRFENSIVFVPVPGAGRTLRYENADQGPSKGFEAELSYQLNQDWLLRSTAMLLTDKPVDSFREAERMFSLMALWQYADWRSGLTAVYAGTRQMATGGNADALLDLPSYWQVDGKLSYALTPNWEVSLQVKNAFDKYYETPPQVFTFTQGVPNRGREWALSLLWEF